MKKLLLTIVVTLVAICSFAQPYRVTGHVLDSETGESVLYATCVNNTTGRATTTNNFGFFSLTANGETELSVSCIGYANTTVSFIITSDTMLTITIKPIVVDINEVVVSATLPEREQVQMGKNTITPEMIRSIPSFLAEPDLIKTISFLPGISMGREGYSNIFVRGGDRGQNLALLDGIKIYNVGHVGGFLSLFNSDIVKNVDVYKGGFPAQYGGRTSSVIDVATKDGNSNQLAGSFTLGTLTSSLLVESPIGKDITFFLAGRASYYTLFMIPKRREYEQNKKNGAPIENTENSDFSFFDINSKVKWRINATSSLAFALFVGNDYQRSYGQDVFNSSFNTTANKNSRYLNKYKTKNQGVSLTYVKSFGSLFWRNTISMSKYTTNQNNLEYNNIGYDYYKTIRSVLTTEIKDVTMQSRLEYDLDRHKIKGGIELNHYNFNPGLELQIGNMQDSVMYDDTLGTKSNISAWENSIYIDDELKLTDKLSIEAGLRGTIYLHTDTTYRRIEPRLSLRYLFNKHLSVKANYTIMNQFNHVMVNNNEGMEEEIWIASTKKIKPQQAQQVSLGVFYGNDDQKANASAELYYKKMQNLIEYMPPTEDDGSLSNIEDIVLKNGEGRAYGLEVMLSKDFEKFSTSISYTLSKNERHFDEMNNGKWYLFTFDRTHDLCVVAHYRFNQKWQADGNFVFSSGRPCSLPSGVMGGIYIYEGVNEYRMPPYHRLDLGVKRHFETRKGLKSQLSLNIYNVYARQNAARVFYRDGVLYQTAMFSIIPSISYTITL